MTSKTKSVCQHKQGLFVFYR